MARVPARIDVEGGVVVPGREIRLKAVRASGPGGQHVNRTASKVELRWNVLASGALDDEARERVLRRLASRLTNDGELILTVETERDQHRNVEEALARFVRLVGQALRRPRPRKATRPTISSRERRLSSKRRTSAVKRSRRTRDDD